MNAENIISFAPSSIPAELIGNMHYGLKKFNLAKQILAELHEGTSLEETIRSRLVTLDPSVAAKDAAMLAAGVDDTYKAMDQNIDKEWLNSHLNAALMNMNTEQRVTYLKNILALTAESKSEDIQEEVQVIIAWLDSQSETTDEDIDAALTMLYHLLDEGAGILQRSFITGLDGLMARLPQEAVLELAGQGPQTALANAAAAYILQKSGEGKEQEQAETPYQLGSAAVTAVEGSKLMALYYKGKITLAYLGDQLRKLFTAAGALAIKGVLVVIAAGIQVSVGLTLFSIFSSYMSGILALILAVFASTILITNKDITDTLEFFWAVAKGLWDGAKRLLRRLFLPAQSDELNEDVETAEADVVVEADEETSVDEDAEEDDTEEDVAR